MHGVVLTSVFERQVRRAGLLEDELLEIVAVIAADPQGGDLVPGTGGARKMRHAGRGWGKSGGYRTIHYYAGADVPLFLLALINKGERANLTNSEKNALAAILPMLGDAYRKRQ